jgi:hypothetical protein
MKRLLVIAGLLIGLACAALIVLAREPTQLLAVARQRPSVTVDTRGGVLTARVEVPTDKPVAMGLPVWTNVLPTMPASPPPIDTQPPAVPAAALR